jgi:hypothetical protein
MPYTKLSITKPKDESRDGSVDTENIAGICGAKHIHLKDCSMIWLKLG